MEPSQFPMNLQEYVSNENYFQNANRNRFIYQILKLKLDCDIFLFWSGHLKLESFTQKIVGNFRFFLTCKPLDCDCYPYVVCFHWLNNYF